MDVDHTRVFDILSKSGSMPFLELVSRCEIGEKQLQQIIDDLQNSKLVTVSNRENILAEFVTLTALTASRSARASA